MGWDDLGYWITWALFVLLALVIVALLIIVVFETMSIRRSLRGGTKTPALSLGEVLERIPDVRYQELRGGADSDDRETYVRHLRGALREPGEACGVLPGCGHVFHKLCVAEWLWRNSTCPLDL